MDFLKKAQEILKEYNQEHLLYFYNELEEKDQKRLLNQIFSIDFKKILELYKNSYISKNFAVDMNTISPINHVEKDMLTKFEIARYKSISKDVISKNQVAVVTMAGGQGSRLGFKGPKGTYELKIDDDTISLYEILCNDLKKINKEYGITLNWYIMTSIENDRATKIYFTKHNNFGYPVEKIKFFTQENLPLVKIDGNLFLQEPYIIKEASNGNGNVFKSLKKSGLLDDMESKNIKYVTFGGIDNILLKNIDPAFLGMMMDGNYEVASKSVFKDEPMGNVAVYCKKDNKPAILNYEDITEEITMKKFPNGTYCYRECNMLSHIMTFEAVKKSATINLQYHRAFKKNAFVNEEGVKQVPDAPNSFKFEQFIFDAFGYFDDMFILRVNEDEEFAPIKSFTGPYNPDAAIEKYRKNLDF